MTEDMPRCSKAIVFEGPEDVYGPCGCGMDMAILPVLVPKVWYVEERPVAVEDQGFCRGRTTVASRVQPHKRLRTPH